jgi:HD superfamily phosphohydrolase
MRKLNSFLARGFCFAIGLKDKMNDQKENQEVTLSDPYYGLVVVPSFLVPFLEAPEFQRLRRTKMGMRSVVYPAANTTRFEHSVGVMHLAGKVLSHLRVNPNGIGARLLKLASLYHDVGHASKLSHRLDDYLLERKITTDDHEARSCQVLTKVNARLGFPFTVDEIACACMMITGNHVIDNDSIGFPTWFYKILHQPDRSLVDIDRLDYLQRDGPPCGLPSMRPDFAIHCMAIEEGTGDLCFSDKFDADEINTLRHRLHRTCYKHPKVEAVANIYIETLARVVDLKEMFENDRWLELTDDWLEFTLRNLAPDVMRLIDTREF